MRVPDTLAVVRPVWSVAVQSDPTQGLEEHSMRTVPLRETPAAQWT